MPGRLARFLVLIALVGATIALVYHESIASNFDKSEWEDQLFFTNDQGFTTVADAFQRSSYWRGLYRPLSTNVYYHLARMLGEDPVTPRLAICHVVSIGVFALNVILAFWVCRSFWSYTAALIVALLFCSRVASTETMLYTSQMQTLLPVTFSLLAIKAYLAALERDYDPGLLGASTVFVFLGLLCKESVVMIPPLCLVFALALASSSRRRGLVQIGLAALPLVSLIPWYLLAHRILLVRYNPWWYYEKAPMEIAGNSVAYLVSYSNLAVRPFRLQHGTIFLNLYPTIMEARRSDVLRIGFGVAIALCGATIFLARFGRGVWRPSRDLVWTALGFAIFLASIAPVAIFKDRLLMYYGYFGYFGLSVVVVGAAQTVVRWMLAFRNRGLVVEEVRRLHSADAFGRVSNRSA